MNQYGTNKISGLMANVLIRKLVNEETYNTIVGYIYDYSKDRQRENGCNYRKTLSEILDGYVEMVKNKTINTMDPLFFAEVIANVDTLKRIMTSCYQGKRSTAYIQLKKLLCLIFSMKKWIKTKSQIKKSYLLYFSFVIQLECCI
jgi:hypothetical protein